jgi:C4-dicarboxylate-specific signal transduction histidine kinase
MLVVSGAKLLAFAALLAAGYVELRTAVFPLLEDHLRERAAATATSLASKLDVALGADDRALIDAIGTAALDDRDLAVIEIDDGSGTPVFRRGEPVDGIPARADVQLEGLHLGAVALVFDTARIDRLRAWTSLLAAIGLAVWLAAVAYSVAFARRTVAPVRAMMEFSGRVAHGDFTRQLATTATSDEVGELRDHLNAMTRDLAARDAERAATAEREAAMQRDLVVASRYAGMAEVATGVLHNVGNVLNSLNVAATVIADRLRASRSEALGRAVALYADHPGGLAGFLASDRGAPLPGYLAALSSALVDENARLRDEIAAVLGHVDHIKTIVATQQAYARVSDVRERVELASVIDDALNIDAASFARHGIEVVRACSDTPAVVTDRHKLLQIVVNLVANARDALIDAAATAGPRRLTVRIAPTATGVAIAVADTGTGIPADVKRRIFEHGFTTKKHGHGFGLHASANAARELGGSLAVASDGPGRGATFTLEIPSEPMEDRHALAA